MTSNDPAARRRQILDRVFQLFQQAEVTEAEERLDSEAYQALSQEMAGSWISTLPVRRLRPCRAVLLPGISSVILWTSMDWMACGGTATRPSDRSRTCCQLFRLQWSTEIGSNSRGGTFHCRTWPWPAFCQSTPARLSANQGSPFDSCGWLAYRLYRDLFC